ncbi:diphosphomevalonate decarboxylase [Haploplasma axanthum]|uniref:diphosphomevalonate decarboxylase n=1 Tax=Haploplasma axanthum TaxID=29552 RepID=UPI0003FC172A|nr:diphosphomevalonate decarboxylase [Haploplasma axanthum]
MKIRAYVNFALIKYWGKKDEGLKLPYQTSLSFTVDKLYTETEVIYDKNLYQDIVIINGKKDEKMGNRVAKHMDVIRREYNINSYAHIISENFVPTGAGLASSASAFAALAYAATKTYGLELSKTELSRLARIGSGSASRSIYGDFVIWNHGDDKTSVSKPLDAKWDDFRVIVCMIDENEKECSSSDAMKKSVMNEELYSNWVLESQKDLSEMLQAIENKDIEHVGVIAEKNAEHMHALIEATGTKYKTEKTLEVISKVKALREKGIKAFYTMDAGPNVKIITIESEVAEIKKNLLNIQMIVCKAGFDAHEV